MRRHVFCLLLAALTPQLVAAVEPAITAETTAATVASMPKLTLIMDDLGQNRTNDRRVLALPGPVAVAVLPDARHATELAERAHRAGKTVMLHLPMAPAQGPYAWQPQLSAKELQQRLERALEAVPHASGVNNHMGSRMTDQQRAMNDLMVELQQRHLFFLDSRTNPHTVAAASAQQVGLASLSRDIFLDDDPSPAAIAAQFRAAIDLARKQGSAVIIGHPRATTLALLERELPRLAEAGVDWIDVDLMIAFRGNRAMRAHGKAGVYANAPAPQERNYR